MTDTPAQLIAVEWYGETPETGKTFARAGHAGSWAPWTGEIIEDAQYGIVHSFALNTLYLIPIDAPEDTHELLHSGRSDKAPE